MSLICGTYSFRLKPSKVQQVLLDKHFGCVRYMYSHFLHGRKEQYASWGSSINTVRLLEYKAAWNDKKLIKIDRFYPGSKACHKCGWIMKDLRLSIRQWTCKNGHDLDRDGGLIKSAAKNILQQRLKTLSAGPADYAGGDSSKTPSPEHKVLRNLKPNHL